MKLTNRIFAETFLRKTIETLEEIDLIDEKSNYKKFRLEKADVKSKVIKQANNTYRSALQHDIARAKIKGYKSSFLEEDQKEEEE